MSLFSRAVQQYFGTLSKVPTAQSTKIAASPAVIIVSKYAQFEMQSLDFLLGICFLIIIIKYIEAKGLAAFGYLTFIYFFFIDKPNY